MPAAVIVVNGALNNGYADITCKQGADLNIQLQLQNADGSTYNLAAQSAQLVAVARKSYFTANAVNLTSTVLTVNQGNVNVGMLAAATANLQPVNYVYDVTYIGNDGTLRILEGNLLVQPSVISGGKYNF